MEKRLEEWLHQHNYRMEKILLENEKLEELINESIVSNREIDSLINTRPTLTDMEIHLNSYKQEVEEHADIGIIYSSKREAQKLELQLLISELQELEKKSYILFTIEDIDLEYDWVKGLFISNKKIIETTSKIPENIYNLAVFSKPSSVKTMRKLRTNGNITVINPINFLYQDILLDMLVTLPNSSDYILPYSHFTESTFLSYLREFKEVFLLKRRDYLHPQIITVTKIPHDEVQIVSGQDEIIVSEEEAYYSIRKMIRNQSYNIYKGLPLKKINNLPIEYRVYVQKSRERHWVVTSKIIKHELFSTGSIYHHETRIIDEKISSEFSEIDEKTVNLLDTIPTKLSTYLDYFLPNVGSYYFDFITGEDGNLYLIYIGGVEQFDYLSSCNSEDWCRYLKNIVHFMSNLSDDTTKVRLDEDEKDVD